MVKIRIQIAVPVRLVHVGRRHCVVQQSPAPEINCTNNDFPNPFGKTAKTSLLCK